MKKIFAKIVKAHKAIVAAATSLGTLVVMFAPSFDTKEKAIVGAVGLVINAVSVYAKANPA